jgi:predicted RecA/RadA family phage recombinase
MSGPLDVEDAQDTVATARRALSSGERVTLGRDNPAAVRLRDDVPFGHKVAIRAMDEGDGVIKYGTTIGIATAEIEPGEHVHTHNVESRYSPRSRG